MMAELDDLADAAAGATDRGLLDDLRVIEISEEPAGAYCGKVFADLGADVIKVERPGGDRLRQRIGAFIHLNTNKRSAVVDGDDVDGLMRLLQGAHIVIESIGWGDLGLRRIDVDALRSELPQLVVTTISGFGLGGPYDGYRWTDLVGQAAAWATLPPAYARGVEPVKLPGIAGLCLVGHTAALGALAAALRASASGVGARVDCAMSEALGAVPMRATRWLGWQYNGKPSTEARSTGTSSILLPNGIFPCADGYVCFQATPQQVPAMLKVLDDNDLKAAFARSDAYVRGETKEILDAALYPWLLGHSRAELTAAAQAVGWPVTGVNTPAEVLRAPHLHQRGFWAHWDHLDHGQVLLPGPPYRHSEAGWRFRRPPPELGATDPQRVSTVRGPLRWRGSQDQQSPPLRGIRVLDFTQVWSGPYATQLLADLGAEVIRLENPSLFPPSSKGYEPRPNTKMVFGGLFAGYGPQQPDRPDRPYNRHSMNNSVSRNKLSCTLDPRREDAKELLLRLVDRSDVLIENLKATALNHMGIGEAELLERNPRLIVVRVPPAGLSGDWSQYKGLGAQFDGLSGLAWLLGRHEEELADAAPAVYMDSATGPAAAFAVLAALYFREGSERGQRIEMAQLENVITHIGDVLVDLQLGLKPERFGNWDRYWSPQGIYACRGDFRWLAVSVTNDAEWAALAAVVGGDALALDERYRRSEDRLRYRHELDELLSSWAAQCDVYEGFELLQSVGVPASPVLVDELLEADPQVAHRGWIRTVTSTDTGTHRHLGHALSGIPQAWDRGSPALGEDNEYVYREVLGLDALAYEHLCERRIAVEDYLDEHSRPL